MATKPKDTTKKPKAVKEALVVFSNLMSASGPRIRASVFADGKVKGATAPMTDKGINRLREWAKTIAGATKLAEMVNVSEAGVFATKLEEKLLNESKTIVLEPNDPMAKKLAHASFPDYTGRKFKVQVMPEGASVDVTSYWDGGSREYFVVMNLVTLKSIPVPQNGDPNTKRIAPVKIHENMCVVQHSIFMGKDMGLTFIISDKNAAQLLPDSGTNLDKKEKIVLLLLRAYKPAYRRDEARHAGISTTEYDTIVANLKVKQYVNSSGAITPKGRNAISDIRDLYQLRNESVKPKKVKVVKEDAPPFCDKCDSNHPTEEACAGEDIMESVSPDQMGLILKNFASKFAGVEFLIKSDLFDHKIKDVTVIPMAGSFMEYREGKLRVEFRNHPVQGDVKGESYRFSSIFHAFKDGKATATKKGKDVTRAVKAEVLRIGTLMGED
jgi:hypothetical protein